MASQPPKKRKREEGPRKNVPLELKNTILKRHMYDKEKICALAKEFNIPTNTISTWKKHADKIMKQATESPSTRKRVRPSPFKDVELGLLYWLKEMRSKEVPPPLSAAILAGKAER